MRESRMIEYFKKGVDSSECSGKNKEEMYDFLQEIVTIFGIRGARI